jgi:magnesium transporter
MTASLRDYSIQIRDLYQSRLEVKQNRIMTILTVITSIFMPLTLIAGWYGMNFKYMPELGYKASYPIVIAVSVLIVIISLIFFKKKKWL